MEHRYNTLLHRALRCHGAYVKPYLDKSGLGMGQPKILEYLFENGPCMQIDMANALEIDPAAVSRMVETLARNGFVEVSVDSSCRRSSRVELLDKGRDVISGWRELLDRSYDIMLDGFSDDEKEMLASMLQRICDNFHKERE